MYGEVQYLLRTQDKERGKDLEFPELTRE